MPTANFPPQPLPQAQGEREIVFGNVLDDLVGQLGLAVPRGVTCCMRRVLTPLHVEQQAANGFQIKVWR